MHVYLRHLGLWLSNVADVRAFVSVSCHSRTADISPQGAPLSHKRFGATGRPHCIESGLCLFPELFFSAQTASVQAKRKEVATG